MRVQLIVKVSLAPLPIALNTTCDSIVPPDVVLLKIPASVIVPVPTPAANNLDRLTTFVDTLELVYAARVNSVPRAVSLTPAGVLLVPIAIAVKGDVLLLIMAEAKKFFPT